jgi:crotonobetainyl-CoA:carnitine CoA-transferase CaiB-like acyl-CoA transferase
MREGAFAGVRILDATEGVAGALATMLAADFGADVVRLEAPGGGALRGDPGYTCWNRNKRVVAVDLASAAGRASARALALGADAAVFDAAPGALADLGLDAPALRSGDPALVHLWLPPYGEGPEWADLPQADGLLWAVSGNAFRQFSWEDVPVWLVTPQDRYAHGLLGATALAAALLARVRSGRGDAVTVTGLDAMAAIQGGHVAKTGEVEKLPPRGARGRIPNYRLYRCADGEWLFLAGLMEAHFRAAVRALELDELWSLPGVDGRFASVMAPGVARPVNLRLEARFAEKSRADWLTALRAHGVPAAPVGDRASWFASESIAAIGMRVEVPDPERGRVVLPGVPIRLEATPGSVRHLPRRVPIEEALRDARARPQAAQAAAAAPARAPLDGLRVLDLGVIIAGTYAATFLADLGADVIKVEPLEGDPFRPFGLGFVGWNRGKRSVALDLKHPDGLAAFHDLAARADVVCDNYRRGVLERLGIDFAALRARNPRIVSASVTAYGGRGPHADDPGFDPLLQAQGGIMVAQGGDDEPVFHQVAVHDTASALVLAFGTIAALFARERTGAGQRVETSLAAQSVLLQSGELTLFAGRPEPAKGGRDCAGVSPLRRLYRCADGWIAISCSTAAQADALAADLGLPGAGDAVAIASALAPLPRDAAVTRLRARGVPCVPALEQAEIYASPLLRSAFVAFEQPGFGSVTAARTFARFAGAPTGLARRAPGLGEHAVEVLAESGFGPDAVARLRAARALRAE